MRVDEPNLAQWIFESADCVAADREVGVLDADVLGEDDGVHLLNSVKEFEFAHGVSARAHTRESAFSHVLALFVDFAVGFGVEACVGCLVDVVD